MVAYKRRRLNTRVKRRVKRRMPMRLPRTVRAIRSNALCAIKRTFWSENWTLSTAATSGFWRYFSFNFSQLPSYTELTSLWDQVRVNAIKVTFRPRYATFDGANTTDVTLPGVTNQAGNYVHIIADPTSNVTPTGTYTSTTLNTFLENGGVRSHRGDRPFSVYFKPMVDNNIGSTNTGRRIRAPYFQTGTAAGLTHYGFHAFMQDVNLTGTSGQSFDIFVTYYMTARYLK